MFGRRPEFDEKSKAYPIRALLPAAPLKGRTWYCKEHLDQGPEGSCVGFGWSHELNASPRMISVSYDSARALYLRAQHLDPYPDTPPGEGTSVLAGAKVVKEQGHMLEYRWAFNVEDVMQTIAHLGPVVLGTDWLAGMSHPDVHGLMHATGDVQGGHCYLARGLLMRPTFAKEPVIRIRNSWGINWGRGGDAFITKTDLATLLNDGGEGCVPVVRL